MTKLEKILSAALAGVVVGHVYTAYKNAKHMTTGLEVYANLQEKYEELKGIVNKSERGVPNNEESE